MSNDADYRKAYSHPDYKRLKRVIRLRRFQPGNEMLCAIGADGCELYASEVDHRVPLVRGGSWRAGNLQPACAYCNRAKDNNVRRTDSSGSGSGKWRRPRRKARPKLFDNRG